MQIHTLSRIHRAPRPQYLDTFIITTKAERYREIYEETLRNLQPGKWAIIHTLEVACERIKMERKR